MASIMRFIDRTTRCAVLYRGEKLEKEDINGTQHTYILNICRNPGITQEKLASLIYVNKSNVTRQLALLERNGFVERRPSISDKRAMEVFPTPKAFEAYPTILAVLREWNAGLLEQFSPEEQLLLSTMLEKIMYKAAQMCGMDEARQA